MLPCAEGDCQPVVRSMKMLSRWSYVVPKLKEACFINRASKHGHTLLAREILRHRVAGCLSVRDPDREVSVRREVCDPEHPIWTGITIGSGHRQRFGAISPSRPLSLREPWSRESQGERQGHREEMQGGQDHRATRPPCRPPGWRRDRRSGGARHGALRRAAASAWRRARSRRSCRRS